MENKVDEAYKKIIRIKIVLIFLIFGIVAALPLTVIGGIFTWTFPDPFDLAIFQNMFYAGLVLLIVIPIAGILIAMVLANKSYDNFSYALQPDGVFIRSGIITKTQKIIPYKKIQNLTIVSGLLERKYGLSSIMIETAGGATYRGGYARPEGVIPGIREPEPIVKQIRSKMEESK
jgi:membrane protein YdbS with pleckstrin-like domain